MTKSTRFKEILAQFLFPVLLALPLFSWVALWKTLGWDASLALQAVYWLNLAMLFTLERVLPFETAWLKPDGQLGADVTLSVGAVVVNSLATVVFLWLLTWAIAYFEPLVSLNVWPTRWPFLIQVVLGILLWDLGNHLAHRWAHLVPFLWRFHAVHHAAPRLSVINTGRLHPFDVIKSVAIGAPLPILLGVPGEISLWYAAFNVFIGTLTHANIDLRCGIFNSFINTPNVHRWHHSPYNRETDTNYGETTLVWDRIFGTYYFPKQAPRRNVGLGESVQVSRRLHEALLQPLTFKGHNPRESNRIAVLEPGDAGPLASIEPAVAGELGVAR